MWSNIVKNAIRKLLASQNGLLLNGNENDFVAVSASRLAALFLAKRPGIRVSVLRRFGLALRADAQVEGLHDISHSTLTSATATDTTSKLTAASLARMKQELSSIELDLNGLADDLQITKEAVQRLIWLLDDARDTNNGLERYSPETITHVKNALYAERILKRITIQPALQPSWMKSELPATNRQWRVNDYGIRPMAAPSVVNATVA